ncbi:hypothetical protein Tco_0837609, partial [Tanacetum coccineum]
MHEFSEQHEKNRTGAKSLLKWLFKSQDVLKKEDTELQSKVEQVTETYRQSSTNLTNLTTMLREENVPSVMTNLEAIQNTLNSKNAHHTTLAESYKYLVWNMGPRLTKIEETQSSSAAPSVNTSMPTAAPLSTVFFSNNVVQDIQENSNNEVDEQTSDEYLMDFDMEFHERVLLAGCNIPSLSETYLRYSIPSYAEENDDDDDAVVINPYKEADPLNLPPPDLDTESEDMAVAHTPTDHEQEAEADTVGTITRVPYSVLPFSGTFYVGSGSSRQVFAPGPTGRDVNTLHRKVKGLAQQMVD